MAFNEDYQKFNFYIEDKVEELRETEGWADSKIAYYLRDMAQSLDPKGRKKGSRITINPLTISDDEVKKYPKAIQDKIKKVKETFNKLQETKPSLTRQ